eukprot:maker-scaffold1489_size38734-snap-gene-0.9 protein:Tk11978 transcript:maker-scaffold1489_size38734-snap-gene-0.9-mRNA-1 annotation:"y+l amino acid transporter 2"
MATPVEFGALKPLSGAHSSSTGKIGDSDPVEAASGLEAASGPMPQAASTPVPLAGSRRKLTDEADSSAGEAVRDRSRRVLPGIRDLLDSSLTSSPGKRARTEAHGEDPAADRAAFDRRLATFGPQAWSAVNPVTPLECAGRGWAVIERDVLKCSACQAHLYGKLASPAEPSVYRRSVDGLREKLASAHHKYCFWSQLAVPAAYLNPFQETPHLLEMVGAQVQANLRHASQLPKFSTRSLGLLWPKSLREYFSGRLASEPTSDAPALASAAIMALCGWQVTESVHVPVYRCLICQRKCGSWLYATLADTESPPPELFGDDEKAFQDELMSEVVNELVLPLARETLEDGGPSTQGIQSECSDTPAQFTFSQPLALFTSASEETSRTSVINDVAETMMERVFSKPLGLGSGPPSRAMSEVSMDVNYDDSSVHELNLSKTKSSVEYEADCSESSVPPTSTLSGEPVGHASTTQGSTQPRRLNLREDAVMEATSSGDNESASANPSTLPTIDQGNLAERVFGSDILRTVAKQASALPKTPLKAGQEATDVSMMANFDPASPDPASEAKFGAPESKEADLVAEIGSERDEEDELVIDDAGESSEAPVLSGNEEERADEDESRSCGSSYPAFSQNSGSEPSFRAVKGVARNEPDLDSRSMPEEESQPTTILEENDGDEDVEEEEELLEEEEDEEDCEEDGKDSSSVDLDNAEADRDDSNDTNGSGSHEADSQPSRYSRQRGKGDMPDVVTLSSDDDDEELRGGGSPMSDLQLSPDSSPIKQVDPESSCPNLDGHFDLQPDSQVFGFGQSGVDSITMAVPDPKGESESRPMLGSPETDKSAPTADEIAAKAEDGGMHMKREIGLLEGVAIILGIIIGSGIFISPKGVLRETGSVGMSLVVWSACGFLSMIGALCYAELGTSIPRSGSDYAYISEAFGPMPAFLYLWAANVIFVPTTNAIMGLTVASYLAQPLFPDCDVPLLAMQLIAALCICFLTWLNCHSMKFTTSLQNVFMFTKLAALFIVIVVGMVALAKGGYSKFDNAFANTETEPGKIAVSFYSGIYSYAGWNYLNFMTEELRDPYQSVNDRQNLPRAIFISIPLVTVAYVLANIAYLAVLDPVSMMSSNAVAVTFADKTMGFGSLLIPALVAVSAFGGLSCHIMTSSRLCFVGARQGHFPDCLSMITVDSFTPKPALVFLCILSLFYLGAGDIYSLIDYASFVESMFILVSLTGLLYLRWKRPDMPRPIKVNIIVPITFLFICTFLVFMPLYVRPMEVGMGLLITASGIPVYLIGVRVTNKPAWFQNSLGLITKQSQKLFMAVKED